jgi:hypothetical protein
MKKDITWGSIPIIGLETDEDLNKFSFKELKYIELSEIMKGENNPFSNKTHSEEIKKFIGQHTKSRKNGMAGKKHSNKTKEIIGKKAKELNRDNISYSVSCYSYKDNSFISDYVSLTKACEELNLNRECARLTAVGKRNHTGGYYFKYKTNPPEHID